MCRVVQPHHTCGPHVSASLSNKSFPPEAQPREYQQSTHIRKSVQGSPVRLLHVRLEEVGGIVPGHRRGRRHLDLFDGGEKLRLANSAGYSSRSRCGCAGDEGLGARRRGGEEEQGREGLVVADDHAIFLLGKQVAFDWTKPKDMLLLFGSSANEERELVDFDENENAKMRRSQETVDGQTVETLPKAVIIVKM